MAAQYEKALYSDLKSWYTSLNTIITNYGGGVIDALTIPNEGSTIKATDINNFNAKMTEMKSDTYLKNATYPTYSDVTRGTLITATATVPLANATTTTYLGQIKCRNTVTNTNGTNTNGSNSHGQKTNGFDTFGMYNGRNNRNGSFRNGNFTNTDCSNTSKSNGTYIDLTCVKTST